MELAGRTALVTGASRGVGRAIASALAESGARVYGTSRRPEIYEWPRGVEPVALEASDLSSIERLWGELSRGEAVPSIVVNNAGAGVFGRFEATDFEAWERQIRLLLLGPMRLSQLAMAAWTAEAPGWLVNVGSLSVEYPLPFMSGYNAAKAGLAAFSESLLLELPQERGRVIDLRLGDLDTDFNDHAQRADGGSEQEKAAWAAMGRHLRKGPRPEAVAKKLIQALASERQGTLRAGTFFQTRVASLFGRLVSQGSRRAANLAYYNLRNS